MANDPKIVHRIKYLAILLEGSCYGFTKKMRWYNNMIWRFENNECRIYPKHLQDISYMYPHINMNFILTGRGHVYLDPNTPLHMIYNEKEIYQGDKAFNNNE